LPMNSCGESGGRVEDGDGRGEREEEAVMSSGKRHARRVKPALEGLEDRKLLTVNDAALRQLILQRQNSVPVNNRQLNYITPEGTRVTVTLFGSGSLAGSSVEPSGALDLVFRGTTFQSRILGVTHGGTGLAPLASIRDANTPSAASSSATGSEPLNDIHMRVFDLIDGGAINLMGGINDVYLHSIGSNTAIHVHDLPAGQSTVLRTPPDFQSNNANNASSSSGTIVVNGQVIATNSTAAGGSAGGSSPLNQFKLNPGVVFQVATQMGNSTLGTPPLGNAQIFGFDPATNSLIRFDAVTGATIGTPIPVPGSGTPMSGVGLARNNGHLVALVGEGTTIFAFDVISGSLIGQFSTTSLAANGLSVIDDIGSTDTATYVTDATAGPNGLAQAIDVQASLASGQAVPVGVPFAPQREFQFAGGLTGVAGSSALYALGAAHFDTFQPDQTELGILTFSTTGLIPTEILRTPVPGVRSSFITVGPPGSILAQPVAALGSIDGQLALDKGVLNGQNVVTLFSPPTTTSNTLASAGTVVLKYPNPLAGLSESFHPEIAGAALLDVQGILKRFFAPKTQGAIINVNGDANLIAISSATDTTASGRPLEHIAIPIRNNVQLITTSSRGLRGSSTRNGVVVQKTTNPIGPLVLP
jgi:hypothetical protein